MEVHTRFYFPPWLVQQLPPLSIFNRLSGFLWRNKQIHDPEKWAELYSVRPRSNLDESYTVFNLSSGGLKSIFKVLCYFQIRRLL